LTRVGKLVTRNDSTDFVTRLDQVMTRLEKNSDDSDLKGLWLDSWFDIYDSSTSLHHQLIT